MTRAACIVLIGTCLAMRAAGAPPAPSSSPTEYELKAAVVFNILRLVEKTGRSGEYVTLCAYTAGRIEQALSALEGSRVRGRTLRIRTVEDDSGLAGCDAVFYGRSAGPVTRMIAKSGAGRALTIGNDKDFLAAGGMIAVLLESRSIVIEIDEQRTEAAGWTISSHLLEVARVVRGRPR